MLKQITPPSLLKDQNIKALIKAIEPEFERVKQQIINILIYPRIDELDEEILDLLAYQFHVEGYDLAVSIEEKRNLIKKAITLHRYKGTKYAIKEVLKALSLDGQVKEWFETQGELPPYTFVVITENPPEDIKKLINIVNEYKNTRSRLAIITDGTCRKRATLDRATMLSNCILSSLDGFNKYGVKLCFNKKQFKQFKLTNNSYDNFLTRYLYKGHIPLKENALSTSVKLSDQKANHLHLTLHNLQWTLKFTHQYNYTKMYNRENQFNLKLSVDSLNKKGFQSSYVKAPIFKLSQSKLSSEKNEKLPLMVKTKTNTNFAVYQFVPLAIYIQKKNKTIKINTAKNKLSTHKPATYSQSITKINTKHTTVKRNWNGNWEGSWIDEYQFSGGHSRWH